MKFGIGLPSFASDSHVVPPERLQSYAQTAENYGFAGAWLIEHLIQPPTYATSQLDPLITLSTIAGATESLPVGTSVLLLPLRNPVHVAKRAATLQHLSNRRLTLGLGAGYVQEEFDAVGVDRSTRGARYREGFELLFRLFNEEEVTFSGNHFSLDSFRLEPRIRGAPPRLLAGGGGVDRDGERVVPRGVKARFKHADGWIVAPDIIENIEHDWDAISSHLESINRDPDTIDRVALQYIHLESSNNASHVRRLQRNVYDALVGADRPVEYAMQNWFSGTIEDIRENLAEYERLGFDEVILHPVAREPTELDRQLDLIQDHLHPHYR